MGLPISALVANIPINKGEKPQVIGILPVVNKQTINYLWIICI